MGIEKLFGSHKDPYQPSEHKRYVIADDGYSRERARALRDIHHELQEEFPNTPLALALFGSLTKGKQLTPETASRADMDMHLYFDAEGIEENDRGLIARDLRRRILAKLFLQKDALGYKDVPPSMVGVIDKRFKVIPIDHTSIDVAVQKCFGTRLFHPTEDRIQLTHFFGLDIGEPIKKYRNEFLKTLQTRPDGEALWGRIEKVIEQVERKGDIPESIEKKYPTTLSAALEYYGVS